MGRIIEADGAIAAADRVSVALRRVTVMAGINLALTVILLGVVAVANFATWR